jgi:RNA polymerase sigma-70 factor (ECF subfamily)
MATDTPELAGFSLAASEATVRHPSRLEDEVVALFEQFRAPVFRYLLSFRIPVSEAEDIVQDVFLALFEHLRQGKPRLNLQGWLFRVAHNQALKSRLRERRASAGTTRHSPAVADDSANPEEIVSADQRQRRLLAVVDALPEQDQCCLSLRAEGLRYREIAEVLGISLGSVAASLEKSLSRLRRAEQVRGGPHV